MELAEPTKADLTKADLARRSRMSVSFWNREIAAGRLTVMTRFGRSIRFTEEQISQVLKQYEVRAKAVPTTDQVARKRQERLGRSAAPAT